jgi:hypothetical protein
MFHLMHNVTHSKGLAHVGSGDVLLNHDGGRDIKHLLHHPCECSVMLAACLHALESSWCRSSHEPRTPRHEMRKVGSKIKNALKNEKV